MFSRTEMYRHVEMPQTAKESPLCLKLQDSYPQPNGVGPEPGGPGQLTPR